MFFEQKYWDNEWCPSLTHALVRKNVLHDAKSECNKGGTKPGLAWEIRSYFKCKSAHDFIFSLLGNIILIYYKKHQNTQSRKVA